MIVDVCRNNGFALPEGRVEAFVDNFAEGLLYNHASLAIGQAEILLGLRILVRAGKLPPLKFRDVQTGATVDVLKDGTLQDWPAWLPGDLWDRQLTKLLTPLT